LPPRVIAEEVNLLSGKLLTLAMRRSLAADLRRLKQMAEARS
jgi:hypothetical protein